MTNRQNTSWSYCPPSEFEIHQSEVTLLKETDHWCIVYLVLTDICRSPNEWLDCLRRKGWYLFQSASYYGQCRRFVQAARRARENAYLNVNWIADTLDDFIMPIDRYFFDGGSCRMEKFQSLISPWLSFLCSAQVSPRLLWVWMKNIYLFLVSAVLFLYSLYTYIYIHIYIYNKWQR